MKRNLGVDWFLGTLVLFGLYFQVPSAKAQTYDWNAGSGVWSTAANWTPLGPPPSGSSITLTSNSAGTVNMSIESSKTLDTITKTGTRRWDIQNNGASPATLTANSINGTTSNFIFRNGSGGMEVDVTNVTVTAGSTFFGITSDTATSYLNDLTVSGTTTVSGGVLVVNVQNALTAHSYSLGLLDVSSTGIVTLANRFASTTTPAIANVTGLTGSGGTVRANPTAGLAGLSANLVITNSADYSSATALVDGTASSGVLRVTKGGVGTQTLTGANTYSGGTTINQGVLQVNNDGNLGAPAGSLTFGGGTLAFTSGTTTVNRATTLNAGGGTVRVNSNNSLVTWSGVVSGSGALTKTGTAATQSVLHLTGTNTYTGGTVIEAGILRINEDVNLGDASGSLTFNNGSSTARLITSQSMTSNRQIILNGNGVIATEQLVPETPNVTTWNGVISGTGSLEKRFAGTLLLTADNTYTGATTVTTGSLLVGSGGTGSLATSGVTVAAGALLGGSGEIDGAVTVNGFLAPGNSPGTLTINNSLTLNGTATALMEIGGTGAGQFDQIALTGTLTLDGTIAVTLIDGFDPTAGNSFDLFTGYTGLIVDNGVIFDFSGATLDPGLSWDTSDFLTTGQITVVPEPGTLGLAAIGVLTVFMARQRRRCGPGVTVD